MRESRTVQISIFNFYSQHEFGLHLKQLSDVLDEYRPGDITIAREGLAQ